MVSPKTSFLDWDQTASNNTDVGGIGIQGTNAVSNFDDALRTVMAQLRAGVDGKVVYAAKAGNYTALATDNNAWHRYTATATVSLTAAATLGNSWHYYVQASATVTIDPNGAETINGAATLVLFAGQTASIVCTGSAFIAVVEGAPLSGAAFAGFIYGLTISNNATDATNDIDIAAGYATSQDLFVMLNPLPLTKRLDAAWAVGTGNGGLDTGAIANTWYHVYLIQRSDTGVVDVCFSASSSAPTTGGSIPAAYDRYRRIGSFWRTSGTILAFKQNGDQFVFNTPVTNLSTTAGFASLLVTISVPPGFEVKPIIQSVMVVNVSSNVNFSTGSASAGSANITTNLVVSGAGNAASDVAIVSDGLLTNTSAQIYMSRTVTSGSATSHTVATMGWFDSRGANG